MRVTSTDATGDRRADHVLADVDIDDGARRRLQHSCDDVRWYDGLADDALAPALDPIDRRWLLVSAEVAAYREYLHVREQLLHHV